MAAPGPARTFKRTKENQVGIKDHDTEAKKLKVTLPTFWVCKLDVGDGDVAEWFCQLNPKNRIHSNDPPCFTIKFKKESPFEHAQFNSVDGHAGSDKIRDNLIPSETRIYEYSIESPGKEVLDPGGGVRP